MARVLVGLKARNTSREDATKVFERERTEILKLARSVDTAAGQRQVLITRLRGMEDSSRYWSVFMTIQHLNIVNRGTTKLISDLVSGEVPQRVVSTADVKPSTNADSSVVNEFETVCDDFQKTISQFPDLKTSLTWAHPWFGELNAERWHFFSGFHMGLHRQQIIAIKKGLN